MCKPMGSCCASSHQTQCEGRRLFLPIALGQRGISFAFEFIYLPLLFWIISVVFTTNFCHFSLKILLTDWQCWAWFRYIKRLTMSPLWSLGLAIHFFHLGAWLLSPSTQTPNCQLLEFALVLGFTYYPPTAELLPTIHHIQYCSYKLFSEKPLKIAEEQLLLWYFQKEEICLFSPTG